MPILSKIHWKVKKKQFKNQIWIKNLEIFKFLEINYEDILSVELIQENSIWSHMHLVCMIEEL